MNNDTSHIDRRLGFIGFEISHAFPGIYPESDFGFCHYYVSHIHGGT
jgi:hypothetical protein